MAESELPGRLFPSGRGNIPYEGVSAGLLWFDKGMRFRMNGKSDEMGFHITVDPQFRGQGVAEDLLGAAIEHAKGRYRLIFCHWDTNRPNEGSVAPQKFFERMARYGWDVSLGAASLRLSDLENRV